MFIWNPFYSMERANVVYVSIWASENRWFRISSTLAINGQFSNKIKVLILELVLEPDPKLRICFQL